MRSAQAECLPAMQVPLFGNKAASIHLNSTPPIFSVGPVERYVHRWKWMAESSREFAMFNTKTTGSASKAAIYLASVLALGLVICQPMAQCRVKTSDKQQAAVLAFVKGKMAPGGSNTNNPNPATSFQQMMDWNATKIAFAQPAAGSADSTNTVAMWSDVPVKWNTSLANASGVKWAISTSPTSPGFLTGYSPLSQSTTGGAAGQFSIQLAKHPELTVGMKKKVVLWVRAMPLNPQMQPVGMPSNIATITFVEP